MFTIYEFGFKLTFPNELSILTTIQANMPIVLVFDGNDNICTKRVLSSKEDFLHNVTPDMWLSIMKHVAEYEAPKAGCCEKCRKDVDDLLALIDHMMERE